MKILKFLFGLSIVISTFVAFGKIEVEEPIGKFFGILALALICLIGTNLMHSAFKNEEEEKHLQLSDLKLFAKNVIGDLANSSSNQRKKSELNKLEKLTALSTKIDKLKELNQLLQNNIITKEEFDTLKKELV